MRAEATIPDRSFDSEDLRQFVDDSDPPTLVTSLSTT
jgi:hypothetical protein